MSYSSLRKQKDSKQYLKKVSANLNVIVIPQVKVNHENVIV